MGQRACVILVLALGSGATGLAGARYPKPVAIYDPDGGQEVYWKGLRGELKWAVHHVRGPFKGQWTCHVLVKDGLASAPVLETGAWGRVTRNRDVFWLGTDGGIHQALWNPAGKVWELRTIVAGGCAAAPAVDLGPGEEERKHLFWPGRDHGLWQADWDQARPGWQLRRIVPGGVAPVQPVAWRGSGRADRQDLFYQGTDGALWHASGTGAAGAWAVEKIPATRVDSTPAAPSGQEVFWKGPGGSIWQVASRAGHWTAHRITGQGAASGPAACPGPEPGGEEVFWQNEDGTLGQGRCPRPGRGWSASSIGPKGMMASAPAATSGLTPGRQDLFWIAPDGALNQAVHDGRWEIFRLGD